MLKFTLEKIPFGLEQHKAKIGEIYIINDGTGDAFRGNYKIEFNDEYGHFTKKRIENFNRMKGAWILAKKSLQILFNHNGGLL